jgi:isoquinoline 1-oxidoreductase beta subunit
MSPLSRREFVAAGVAAGAGLVIGFYLPRGSASHEEAFSPNAYVRITPDNKVTIVVARSEMGQGVRTALPMILAEELEADWNQIEIEQAGASTLYGDQSTGGSASVHSTWDPMRKAGATAREMLISAAALTWGVSRSSCTAESSRIKHAASNRSLSYGELAGKAATLPIPTDVTLKQSKDYKIVGQRLARLDTPSKVRGKAIFGIDFRMPGMKFALLSRCPVIGGKVASFDDKESKKISGVSYVGKVGDAAVAVVGDSVWGAMEGRRVLNVTWDDGPNKDLNTAAVMASLKQAVSKKGASLYSAGDAAKAAGRKISAEYTLPFMAHAPMEPGNCTANYEGTKCELWLLRRFRRIAATRWRPPSGSIPIK